MFSLPTVRSISNSQEYDHWDSWMLGISSPRTSFRLEVRASVAKKDRYSGVNKIWQFLASSMADINSVSIWVLTFSQIISPSILAILRSLSFLSIIFCSSIFLTSRFDSALMTCCLCLVTSSSSRTFSFSAAMKKSTLSFSISSKFFLMRSGMLGLVTRMDKIQMPGAHFSRSLLRDLISSSSNLSKMSMQISWRECFEQNWFISWCNLSVIQYFSQSSVQFKTVSQTASFRNLFTTSTRQKQTRVPFDVPQGMFCTTSVWMLTFISIKVSTKGSRKWKPGQLRPGWSTPKRLQMPTYPSLTSWKPEIIAAMQRTTSTRITRTTPIVYVSKYLQSNLSLSKYEDTANWAT